VEKYTFRDHNRTDWESYKNDRKVNLEVALRYMSSTADVELAVDWLQQSILTSYQ
jgi:hypothetical protein